MEAKNSISLARLCSTLAAVLDVPAPEKAEPPLDWAVQLLKEQAGGPIQRALIYNPDAVAQWLFHKNRLMFQPVLEQTQLVLPLRAVMPSVTPVCFGTMYTGAQPEVHGIQAYEKPVIAIDSLFDALVRAGKKVALVAVEGSSMEEEAYASLIEGMDKSLGDLMDWVERNGEKDNTIILFMSDNGGLATNPTWRDGELFHQNYPLLSGKCSLYEGGIREPMIVSWPGVTRAGSKCDKYTMIEDFYPTILEMAGVNKYKTVAPVDGLSFVPMLRETGDTSKGRALVWNFPNIWGNNGPGINLNCAIRKDEWKLIYYYDTGRKELFNIPADISEQHNVAAEHKDIVKRLSRELGEYLRNVGAQRPTFKADGKPCPWPDEV